MTAMSVTITSTLNAFKSVVKGSASEALALSFVAGQEILKRAASTLPEAIQVWPTFTRL